MSDEFDPTADFLARERAALGDEADLFQSITSGSNSAPAASKSPSTSVIEAQPDIFSSPSNNNNNADLLSDAFESTSVIPDTTSSVAITSPPVVNATPSPGQASVSEFQQEWQIKQKEAVEERDRVSNERHEVVVKEARDAIDKFYEEYNEKKDKAIEENRANQEIELQSANKGNLWERAVKQIDLATKASQDQKSSAASATPFSATSPFASTSSLTRQGSNQLQGQQKQQETSKQAVRDTTRMRELLQDLKRDKDAPGVKAKKVEAAA
ncbi:Clathrin light chain [Dipsacomyces acuminosporus]|nr:Clathrin light chain [Dipsacomyces acuminosporus]